MKKEKLAEGIKKAKNALFIFLFLLLLSMMVYACASIGTPEGGDYDIDPPVFVRSNPAPNSVHFSGNKIELFFDEYISLDNPNEKVIITPPQIKAPVIKSIGRKVIVELKDSLIPNVTYTFDFTNSIVDLNEKNPIEGFTFAFSTGDVVDTMVISGTVFNARNMEAVAGLLVGLHVNPDDSAFSSIPFSRTSKTNDRGQFWIRNVAPGSYHVFALEDQNRNYKYDYPSESMAFIDSLIVPDFFPDIRMDTLWIDSITIDTIMPVHFTHFIPDDLQFFLSKNSFEPQYLSRPERLNEHQFVLRFGSPDFLPPQVSLLENSGDAKAEKDWYLIEYSADRKELTYWITDSLIYQQDTIRLKVDYFAHDSIWNREARTDTVQLHLRSRQQTKEKKKIEEEEIPDFLSIKVTPMSVAEIYDTVKIIFGEPVLNFDPKMAVFEQKIDTLWEKRTFSYTIDSLNPRTLHLNYPWNYGQEFRLIFDSTNVQSVYNHWNDSLYFYFKFRNEEEYGDLYIKLSGNEMQGFGELLDGSEKVVRTSEIFDGDLIFENLKPGKYYLRYIEDENKNGQWDPGNYAEKRQPEKIYYYERAFDIRKYVQWEQSWNIKATPRTQQKPLEITKNKPVEKKSRKDELLQKQQEQQKRQNSNSTISIGSGVLQ